MDDFWDFLFNTWYPFIIGGICCLGSLLPPVLVAAFLNSFPARKNTSYADNTQADIADNEDS
jgi:hypothetical protein